jgi:hypothetical protein
MRACLILLGLFIVSLGAFIALGYDVVPLTSSYDLANSVVYMPAKNTPLLGWALWVLGGAVWLVGMVAAMGMWLVTRSRRRQLAQRESPHNA